MGTTIKIDNYLDLNTKELSNLSADSPAGSSSISVENSTGMTNADHILIGRRGAESAEHAVISSIASNTVTVSSPTKSLHNQYEDVTVLFGNKIRIYRADNENGVSPADGSFTLLDTVDIDFDQSSTTYTDQAGGPDYWYKFTYYNSTSTHETSLSDSSAARGGGVGNYETIDNIRSAAGFNNNRNITDSYIDGFRRSAQDQINGKLTGVYIVPFTSPVNSFIAQITKSLAAGHIKLDQFGNTNDEGKAMIDWAEEQLEKIRSGAIALTDLAGNSLPKPNGSSTGVDGARMGFSGSPNDSEDGGGFKFTSDMRY